ncbi:uridine phosphorylase 1-like [Ptychodera flava]|uniref:uridine phosphorylase 1-like n=1 Tax=Ptychodera flava TaxID=63121 RepID=UPI00396A9CB4
MAKSLEKDFLYHLGWSTDDDLKGTFGDLKFVCTGGSTTRMEKFAKYILGVLSASGLQLDLPTSVKNLCRSDRYVMYKVGPVLSINHGMGMPSTSIMLNEVIKLLRYAGCTDVVFIRLGTSGGVGVEPGTVVITEKAVNYEFKPVYQLPVLGQLKSWDATLSTAVANEIKEQHDSKDGYDAVLGNTMGTDDFYEGQGRLDGALCDYYTEQDKMDYLQSAHESGVRNIEMEGNCLASMVSRANFEAAIVCVALLNRLHGDQVTTPKETLEAWEERPQQLVARYIVKKLKERQDNQ